jgi:hypothetical protein
MSCRQYKQIHSLIQIWIVVEKSDRSNDEADFKKTKSFKAFVEGG